MTAQSKRTIRLIEHQIFQAVYGSKHEIIEGVEIDFRHPEYDLRDWEPLSNLFKSPGLYPEGPNLWFPWSEVFETNRLQIEEKTRLGDSTPADMKYVIESGDRVRIRRIVTVPNHDSLLRGCNRETKHVFVNNLRKNGF